RPRGLHRSRQVRRPRPAAAAPGRGRADRRPRRAPHARRDVRTDPRPRTLRRPAGGGGGGTPLRGARPPLLAPPRPRLHPLRRPLFWPTPAPAFPPSAALLASLERRPPAPVLVRMREADDHRALAALGAD